MMDVALPASTKKSEAALEPFVRLTRRDLELFAFLLEQGFLTLEAVYLRFFDSRKSSSDAFPPRLEVTRQRLRLLERAGFIKSQAVALEKKSVYLLSVKGYRALLQKLPERAFEQPLRFVDLGAFEHDKAITFCRIALEKGGKAFSWYPERRIKTEGFSDGTQTLDPKLIPDGLFLNSKGERVALEVEPARKARDRYEEKMSYYRWAFAKGLIAKVLYVTRRTDIAKEILSAARGNDRVLVEHYDYFLRRLFPEGEKP